MRTVLTTLAGLAGTVSAGTAAACSMASSYIVPTNLELAAAADTIVVAVVEGERRTEDRWSSTVLARPIELVKGERMPGQIEIVGASLSLAGEYVAASPPRELRAPNPDALRGGCVRYSFRKGTQLLLFLKRDEAGALKPYRSAFSRDAEDVSGKDALWVKAVREYAAMSGLPRRSWPGRLRRRIAELRARSGDRDAIAIADDMAIELAGKPGPPFD